MRFLSILIALVFIPGAFAQTDRCMAFCSSDPAPEPVNLEPLWWGLGITAFGAAVVGIASAGAESRNQRQQQTVIVRDSNRP
jgi:hypothetical protein